MTEEVNNLEKDDYPHLTEFKINTLIFCSQKSLSQIVAHGSQIINENETQHNKQNEQVFQSSQKLQNGNSIDINLQHAQQINKNSENTTPQVEVKSSEVILTHCLERFHSSENEKTSERQLSDKDLDSTTATQIEQKKAESKQISDNSDVRNIQKQVNQCRNGLTLHKSNSENMFNNQYEGRSQYEKQKMIENESHIRSADNANDQLSKEQSKFQQCERCESPEDCNVNLLINSMLVKNDLEINDLQKQSSQTQIKKSKFHADQSQFCSDEQENKHKMMLEHFQEVQSFDQQNSRNDSHHAQTNQTLFRSKSLYNNQIICASKLFKVKKAIIAIQRLARNPTTQINSINQLEKDLRSHRASSFQRKLNQSQLIEKSKSPVKTQYAVTENNEADEVYFDRRYKEAFDDLRKREKLSLLCERGSQEDVLEIKKMIESDPKKYLRDPKDPQHMLNCKNLKKQTPLYIACKNGNLEVVKLLIIAQCNYLLEIHISKNLNETPLEAAIRWNHIDICNYMLEKCSFEDKYLVSCLPLCSNTNLKLLIQNKIKKKSTACNIF